MHWNLQVFHLFCNQVLFEDWLLHVGCRCWFCWNCMNSQFKQSNNPEPLFGFLSILMAFSTYNCQQNILSQQLSCTFCVGFVLDLQASFLIELWRTHCALKPFANRSYSSIWVDVNIVCTVQHGCSLSGV